MLNEIQLALTEKELKPRFFSPIRNRAFCPRCDRAVELLRFDEAAAYYRTVIGEIAALSEAGGLHKMHNGFGEVLICRDSLSQELSRRETQKFDAELLPRLN